VGVSKCCACNASAELTAIEIGKSQGVLPPNRLNIAPKIVAYFRTIEVKRIGLLFAGVLILSTLVKLNLRIKSEILNGLTIVVFLTCSVYFCYVWGQSFKLAIKHLRGN